MDHFQLIDGELCAEQVPLAEIARHVGTPVYVYSRATFERHARVFREALSGLEKVHIAFAVKSNPNLAVLRLLSREGYGADVVSEGEMNRALAAGMPAADIVFSGVGKSKRELTAAVKAGIGQFNLESEEEGVELAEIAAALGLTATCALRVNPDVDARTHAKISTGKAENKFGVAYDRAGAIYARLSALEGLNMRGLAVHIGSQITDLEPSREAFVKMGVLMEDLRGQGLAVTHMDLGGGLGVPYKGEEDLPTPADYGAMVVEVTKGWNATIMFEPGRVISGNAGVLVSAVIRVKEGTSAPFIVVDAAMNDLARPAMYDAWHDFAAVKPSGETWQAHVVGPICESSDVFAKNRKVDVVKAGDLVVFRTAGAYGATMANTYNSRALVPEVMVDGDAWALVAGRIEPETILAAESVPDFLA
ncbi:diaminopimelate decarboxylase [Novosphingobium profundi]|uniref:diaminopimelate decarboxylase n=1 Tax=Novosphingobium profundi TaxID=1774954 RepID=UPI001BDB1F79|nr:diaminopimelate decarboxylase [Novosphingobium profundi]MBT0669966.1 diaminopimelate decarboxylase [Novosphingobium profundi]